MHYSGEVIGYYFREMQLNNLTETLGLPMKMLLNFNVISLATLSKLTRKVMMLSYFNLSRTINRILKEIKI